jgi:hypothetical protein
VTDVPETTAPIAPSTDNRAASTPHGPAGRLGQVFFLVIVARLLVVPLLQTIYPVVWKTVHPVDEHRAPSPFPSLRSLLSANGVFSTGLNRWFD